LPGTWDNEPIRIAFVIDAIETPTGGTERQLVFVAGAFGSASGLIRDFACCRIHPGFRDCFFLITSYVLNIRSFKNQSVVGYTALFQMVKAVRKSTLCKRILETLQLLV
jgi:hypothetical protein